MWGACASSRAADVLACLLHPPFHVLCYVCLAAAQRLFVCLPAAQVDKWTKTKKSTTTNFELFSLR